MAVISSEDTLKMKEAFSQDKKNILAQRASATNGLLKAAEDPFVIARNRNPYSTDLVSDEVTNQKHSGRCWMFAGLNVLRFHLEKKLNVENFELSQNFLYFYDKLEKSNYFYENVIATADDSLDDRKTAMLFEEPESDGGWWQYVVNLVKKYGVIPKNSMPETANTENSDTMNELLNRKLRQDALKLRDMVRAGASGDDIEAARAHMLEGVYSIVSVALGTPPESFRFQYQDKDKKYHDEGVMTPKGFFDTFIGTDMDDYIALGSYPADRLQFNRHYSRELMGNMVGSPDPHWLNVTADDMKAAAVKQLQDGEPVWFGCDVGQSSDRKSGVMDTDLYDMATLVGVEFTMDKRQRIMTRESAATHAMTLAGVDVIDGRPVRWKVENSWGDENGQKGYFVMTDPWFDEYTFEAVINKKYLSEDIARLYETEPEVLPYYLPF